MKLTIIRGLPGSGKSTLAKSIAGAIHLETDMYWGPDYAFDISKIKEAHEWCQREVYTGLVNGHHVVVSNTFTTKKEIQPYLDMCEQLRITPQIVLCQGRWDNVHNVPVEVLERMKTRFEYEV